MDDVQTRARRIRMLALDIDGVLTDGRLTFTESGQEIKSFNVRDGHGLVMALRSPLKIIATSGRRSTINARQLKFWGLTEIHQRVRDKDTLMASLLTRHRLGWDELGYMGDDVVDLRVMKKCGLALAPVDADPEVHRIAHWVSTRGGGQGCVREALEMILRAQEHWDTLMEKYR